MRVVHQMAAALQSGDAVAVFPEGTTGDGHALLPFHANLLQAAVVTSTPLQPLSLRFSEPGHAVSPSAIYVGDTTLVQSLWRIACAQGLQVRVRYLSPVDPAGHDRRSLSRLVQERISAALPQEDPA
jgi:1-acyl-sn-glycerol-3-phosphate acyltransferase